jgi:hypothetical protein
VEFLHVELSLSWLGLLPEAYEQLLDETTLIIHCAWKVDLNNTIEAFSSYRFVACGAFLTSISTRGAKLPWCSCQVSRRLLASWHSRRTLQCLNPLSVISTHRNRSDTESRNELVRCLLETLPRLQELPQQSSELVRLRSHYLNEGIEKSKSSFRGLLRVLST